MAAKGDSYSMQLVNRVLARRLELSEADHWASLMAGLDPAYGAEVKRFGENVIALSCPGMARRDFVNRILGAGPDDQADLERAIAWMLSRGDRCRVDVSPHACSVEFLESLGRRGFRQLGFQTALYLAEDVGHALGMEVRVAETAAELAFVTSAFPPSFGVTDATWVQWLEDSARATYGRPDWRTYVAYVDGEMAGYGQLHIAGGVGTLVLAGTLERFRGRGAQTALIHRRIADARAAGCDLIVTQTGQGTVSQHNMERAGFRIAYTKAEFYYRP